ncbi:hypothetical protein [Pelosinus fermentans]|nr:hypothetical protein [Pelosinus fermentans]
MKSIKEDTTLIGVYPLSRVAGENKGTGRTMQWRKQFKLKNKLKGTVPVSFKKVIECQ